MKIDINKILTTVIIAVLLYVGSTVYQLDKDNALQEYKLEQIHLILQDMHENKKDK